MKLRKFLDKSILACLMASLLVLSSCGAVNSEPVASETYLSLDTVVTISIYSVAGDDTIDPDTILKKAREEIDKYNALFDPDEPSSDIYKINHAGGETVEVSSDTAYLIDKALYFSGLTAGKIDITTYPLKELWNEGSVPSSLDIENVLSHVDYNDIIVDTDKNTVCLKDPSSSIDLGFIAKGYIADKVKEKLLTYGVKSAIIDLGGNVQTIGTKPDNSAFTIGIKKPFSKNGEIIETVEATDVSVVTAGTYERFFEENGSIYHHILDPATGYPSDSGLVSVTVIYPESTVADALSTSCILLGYDRSVEILKQFPGCSAIFITDDGKMLRYS